MAQTIKDLTWGGWLQPKYTNKPDPRIVKEGWRLFRCFYGSYFIDYFTLNDASQILLPGKI